MRHPFKSTIKERFVTQMMSFSTLFFIEEAFCLSCRKYNIHGISFFPSYLRDIPNSQIVCFWKKELLVDVLFDFSKSSTLWFWNWGTLLTFSPVRTRPIANLVFYKAHKYSRKISHTCLLDGQNTRFLETQRKESLILTKRCCFLEQCHLWKKIHTSLNP